ncbi:hypothetical protein Tco_0472249 [Tanacetum coccineum]
MELKTSSSFKTTGLLQLWQTLCKIFFKCLTTRVIGWDQPLLQIMQMMYCFVNNIHVDYAELLWEGIYYSLHHPTSSIPYPRFTKIIVSHYMTIFPEISRRARDMYHNLQDDDIMKNIFNSGRHKDKVGMQIPDWMITEEMKHTEHYRMYAEVFGLDVPLTQSQPTESTQGTHRTPSAPRSPTLKKDTTESISLADQKGEKSRSRVNMELLFNKHLELLRDEKFVKDLRESGNIQAEISSQIQKSIDNLIHSQVDASVRSYMSGHILYVHLTQTQTLSVPKQQYQLYLSMKGGNNPQLQQQDIAIWLALQMKGRIVPKGEDNEYEGRMCLEIHRTGQVIKEASVKDIMEEVSLDICEAKLKKMANEMLRQRCTSGDEHQYHIDQMKNFLKSDIVWESRKEILVSPHPRKTTPLVQSCQRDPEAPALSLINQDLLYLKKGSSRPEKMYLSLHKLTANIFNDDDIEPGKPKEEVYSNSKIIQVIKTYWELGHEHKFITEIVARRANECIVSITEPDYKNLNKNDIEDMYLLIMNGKVPDYAETGLLWSLSVFIRSSVIWERVHDFQLGIESYQQKVNLTAPTISFPGVEKHKMFSIIYEPVHGIIYKNSKKEKRVMRHSEIHKFCDATLNRVLEGLKSYNNDVKYGYVQRELTNDEVEYLKLFEEEIEVRLKYRNQMRRWEMYVNGRPLGPRRERPE